jgi:hypothetical protein
MACWQISSTLSLDLWEVEMSDESVVTQRQLLDILEKQWGQYVSTYRQLSAKEQDVFLERQGYESFHDLLAHICAWWEETLTIVNAILDNEELPEREYDIEQFNIEALDRFRDWKEDNLVRHFENLREALLDVALDLPDEALAYPRISSWLNDCVVEHFEEHRVA